MIYLDVNVKLWHVLVNLIKVVKHDMRVFIFVDLIKEDLPYEVFDSTGLFYVLN